MQAIRFVQSMDGTRIALEEIGDEGASLLMVPGSGQDRSAWSTVARHLTNRYHCVLMDRRGRGESEDTEPYRLQREYEDVVAAAASLDPPVFIAGHSSGAVCALGAIRAGAAVSGAVLYEPPWPVERSLPGADQIDDIERLATAGDPDGALELALRAFVGVPGTAIPRMKGHSGWQSWRKYVSTWPRELKELNRLPRDLPDLHPVDVPVLVLIGEATSGHLKTSTLAITASLANASLVRLAGQGHTALASAPELVAQAILHWTNSSVTID